MALGAQTRSILTGVLLEGLVIASIGIGVGVVFGLSWREAIGRYVADTQFRGAPLFILSALVILAAAVVASAVPAARAARVNPVEALRSE